MDLCRAPWKSLERETRRALKRQAIDFPRISLPLGTGKASSIALFYCVVRTAGQATLMRAGLRPCPWVVSCCYGGRSTAPLEVHSSVTSAACGKIAAISAEQPTDKTRLDTRRWRSGHGNCESDSPIASPRGWRSCGHGAPHLLNAQ